MNTKLDNVFAVCAIIAFMLFVLVSLFLLPGCSQRIVEYNPETGVIRYKSNHVATDSTADYIRVKTPKGIEVELMKPEQDNDSVKAYTPWGFLETTNP